MPRCCVMPMMMTTMTTSRVDVVSVVKQARGSLNTILSFVFHHSRPATTNQGEKTGGKTEGKKGDTRKF